MNNSFRESLIILSIAVVLFAMSCASAYAMDEDDETPTVNEGDTSIVVRGGPTNELDALCGGNNAKVDAGGFGAAFPSYPCETVRTDLALERLEGRPGFRAGSTRFFLNARLFMRGINAMLFGLIGLG